MLPELGHFGLSLALFVALALATPPIAGAARGNTAWMALARPAAQAQFVFVALGFGALMLSFANNDFSVVNVVANSNRELPLVYRLAATWGSHEVYAAASRRPSTRSRSQPSRRGSARSRSFYRSR